MLRDLFGIKSEKREAVSYQSIWGAGLDFEGNNTASGKKVSDENAMQLSAVYGSVRILSDGVSTLPVRAMRGKGPQATPAVAEPSWFHYPNPNDPFYGWIEFVNQVMTSLLLRGNAYVATIRKADGFIEELRVLDPDRMKVEMTSRGPLYVLDGQQVFDPFEVMHVRGLMLPGHDEGISPIDYARETIGLGLAAQEYGAAFFGNGALPGAVIEVEEQMTKEGAALMKRNWRELHGGSGKANGLAVLTEGAKFKPITVTPEQAQFLATRGFQVADIARFFGVPPHLLQDASGSTSWGSGLAEQSSNYVTHSLRPWVERLEQAFSRLAQSERPTVTGAGRLYVHLNVDHLLRGDYSTRISTYRSGLESGIYSINEVRAFEGLPSIGPEGDDHRVPLNTAPTDQEPSDAEQIAVEAEAEADPAPMEETDDD